MKGTRARIAAAAVAGTAALTIAAGPVASAATVPAAQPAAATTSSAHPSRGASVALEPCAGTGIAKSGVCWMTLERHFQLMNGPEAWVSGIRWSHWGPRTATGRGVVWGRDVTTSRLGRATIRLSRPEVSVRIDGRNHCYFTRLVIGRGARGIVRHLHWVWDRPDNYGEWEG